MYEDTSKEELIQRLSDARQGKMEWSEGVLANVIAELRRRAGPREKKEKPKAPARPPRFFYMTFKASGRVWRVAVAYVVNQRDVVFHTAWCNPKDRYSKKYGRKLALARLTGVSASLYSEAPRSFTFWRSPPSADLAPRFSLPRGMRPAEALHLLLSRSLELRTFGVRLVRVPDGLVRDYLGDFKETPAELSARLRAGVSSHSERLRAAIRITQETEHSFRVSPQSDGTIIVEKKP